MSCEKCKQINEWNKIFYPERPQEKCSECSTVDLDKEFGYLEWMKINA